MGSLSPDLLPGPAAVPHRPPVSRSARVGRGSHGQGARQPPLVAGRNPSARRPPSFPRRCGRLGAPDQGALAPLAEWRRQKHRAGGSFQCQATQLKPPVCLSFFFPPAVLCLVSVFEVIHHFHWFKKPSSPQFLLKSYGQFGVIFLHTNFSSVGSPPF